MGLFMPVNGLLYLYLYREDIWEMEAHFHSLTSAVSGQIHVPVVVDPSYSGTYNSKYQWRQ
jgi:hypothetical protein